MRMAVIDIIKRFFSSGDAGFPVPPRLGKGRMAGCVQEARQIAETARRKRQEELDAERGVPEGLTPLVDLEWWSLAC